MVRLLLVVFFVGLVVSIGASATVAALGGAHYNRWEPRWSYDDRGGRSWGWTRDDDIGPSTTRDYPWTAGSRLEVDVPASITYTQGPTTKITASGGQHELDDLVVEGDRIHFVHRHRWDHDSGLILTITAPSVRQFELNGAQKLDISNYAQDDLDLQVNGAGQVNASGSAKSLRLELNGAGQGNLGGLANQTANVEINGAGEATLATTDSAAVEINGMGHARLLNNPHYTQHINGFGNVETGVGGADATKAQPDATKSQSGPPAAIQPKTHGKAAPV